MENAADALKMAAWVLIFVTALSITINSFSQARESIDSIVTNIDREYITEYVEESGSTKRRVGIESIIPAIYRSVYYNYKIIFPDSYDLYHLVDSTGNETPVNYIDLETGARLTEQTKEIFISYILYGGNQQTQDTLKKRLKLSDKDFKQLDATLKQSNKFNDNGLYTTLKGKTYDEDVGVYYQGEENGGNNSPNANKTEKRVITYTEVE